MTEGINWHVSAQDSMQEYYVVLSSQNATRDSKVLLQSCLPSPCQLADSLHCGDTLQLVRDGVIRLALDEDVVEQNFAHCQCTADKDNGLPGCLIIKAVFLYIPAIVIAWFWIPFIRLAPMVAIKFLLKKIKLISWFGGKLNNWQPSHLILGMRKHR
ncbi:MAG: hypothetical protein U0V54_05930 [Saprospiraceae bacterium]